MSKIKISFKTPDAMFYAEEDMSEEDKVKFEAIAKKFIEYGECLTVEIDTDAGTCVVVPV